MVLASHWYVEKRSRGEGGQGRADEAVAHNMHPRSSRQDHSVQQGRQMAGKMKVCMRDGGDIADRTGVGWNVCCGGTLSSCCRYDAVPA